MSSWGNSKGRNPKPAGSGSKTNAQKKNEIDDAIHRRKEAEKRAHEVVLATIDGEISAEVLQHASRFIDPSHYNDIVTERSIGNLCGYPLCSQPVTNNSKQPTFRIDAKLKLVYDISERRSFCSNNCYAASLFYKQQLSETPVWLRVNEVHEEVEVLKPEDISGVYGKPINITGSDVPVILEQIKRMDLQERSEKK